jgi:hypothetical protein
MKTKTFKKKLTLNKKTVVNLNNSELNDVKGGCATEVQSCPLPNTSNYMMICETCCGTCSGCKTLPLTNCTCNDSCDIYGCVAIIER